MKKIVVIFASVFLFFVLSAQINQQVEPEFVEGEILVKFTPTISVQSMDALIADVGAQTVEVYSEIGVRKMRLPQQMTVQDGVERLAASASVEYAEPNYIYHTFLVPDDPHFNKLWGLNNTGQTGGTNDADIDAPEAWEIQTGSDSVIIGIIDTGVDFKHEDLQANIWTNPGEDAWSDPLDPTTGNGVDDDGNGKIDDWKGWNFISNNNNPLDDHSHGTHTAGTIGGTGNNTKGVVGVNWNVKIMPLKFLNASGSGSSSDAIDAILYAAKMNANILNNSWGGGGKSQALEDAIKIANQAGVLFVVAAGNDGTNNDTRPTYPANYDVPNVLSVAASDHKDYRAIWSGEGDDGGNGNGNGGCGLSCNGGATSAPGSNYGATTVDLAAPGKDIYSTIINSYDSFSGTSMATPHVAGAAGLLLAQFPQKTHLQIKQKLMDTVDPLPAFTGKCVSEGRLNIHKALTTP